MRLNHFHDLKAEHDEQHERRFDKSTRIKWAGEKRDTPPVSSNFVLYIQKLFVPTCKQKYKEYSS